MSFCRHFSFPYSTKSTIIPVDSGLKYHNLFADDDHTVKAKPKSASKLCKQSRTFMKPTASHLAKQINSVDIQTHSGCEVEDTKRQKLEIGFLRKVDLLGLITYKYIYYFRNFCFYIL